MTIRIKFFAVLRDRMGTRETTLDLSAGKSVADAVHQLASQHPTLEPVLSKLAFVVNEHYVPKTSELHDGDELALIPPVSGG